MPLSVYYCGLSNTHLGCVEVMAATRSQLVEIYVHARCVSAKGSECQRPTIDLEDGSEDVALMGKGLG
jgi:hypothetical protein